MIDELGGGVCELIWARPKVGHDARLLVVVGSRVLEDQLRVSETV